ncbi:hypothetical protein MFLO_15149 [Listeria floridensis FSL S10-1187]|uniref:Uncharacterized protein n=1 Tax=Listeria floridensis FSL S10-1187 TaxID=1265817 RepID=A0ABN0RBM5_9LIST|nr:hypothetical protein MFLO_15149 [Listeria floridensis FSL S10-1187]
MEKAFYSLGAGELNIANWNSLNVTNMKEAFSYAYLSTLKIGTNFRFAGDCGLPWSPYEVDPRHVYSWECESNSDWVYHSTGEFVNNYDGTQPGTYHCILKKE